MAEKASTTTQKTFKSCVECRRRKIRCSWTKEDTRTCRRCEERRVPCIPQVSLRNAAASSRASSKARISQLEAQVKELRNTVHAIQNHLNPGNASPSYVRTLTSISDQQDDLELATQQDDDENDSDDSSSRASEIILQDRPSHLESLFQNELITTDARRNIQIQHTQQVRTMGQRLESARKALQALVPTQEQVTFLGSHVSSWLTLLQEMSPTTSLSVTTEGIIASYPMMKQPHVDPFNLACWLLALAITAQQLHPPATSPTTPDKKFRTAFPQAVQRAVEGHIISHDSLCGSLAGLETCLMFLRLSLMKGIIQKSWLGLRRVISIAELIGLPRASKLLQQRSTTTAINSIDPHTIAKAKLWESICSVERLAGTLMHFPIATRHHSLTTYEPLVSNGIVNPATFWIRLGNIAVQLSDLDELAPIPGSESELYSHVLRLDNESRLLASETPREWWTDLVQERVTSKDIIKFQFYCIAMRIHLPFVVRADIQDRFAFSRMAGVEACRNLTTAWCDLRRVLPSGMFFSRPFDAQAFTAAVVLLLDSYNSEASSFYVSNPMNSHRNDTDILLARVLDVMDEKAQDLIGSEYAQQASSALRSLMSLLKGDSESNEITAKIPSLGTITVRRKRDKWVDLGNATTSSSRPSETSAVPASGTLPFYPPPTYSSTEFQVPDNPNMPQLSSNSVDDVFSWVINLNDEILFQDNLMFEDGFNLNQWQNSY